MTGKTAARRPVSLRRAKTGGLLGAVRRVPPKRHSDAKSSGSVRVWAAAPDIDDSAVRAATGKGWDAWCNLIDAWPGHAHGHTAIAAHLQAAHGVDGWWAQCVTVGYERIIGRRLPHQQPDGTFAANASRTIGADAAGLRRKLLDDARRPTLFPGIATDLRSRPNSKNIRIAIGPGTAEIAVTPQAAGRVRVAVQHTKLPSIEEVRRWKAYWSEWLRTIAE